MARMEFTGTEEMMNELFRESERLGRKALEMLDAGGERAVKAWQNAIEKAGHAPPGKSGKATGDLIRGVRATAPKKKGERYECSIYPQGRDRKKQKLQDIAFTLHYGTSKIRGDHFVDLAEEEIEQTVHQIMADVWERD